MQEGLVKSTGMGEVEKKKGRSGEHANIIAKKKKKEFEQRRFLLINHVPFHYLVDTISALSFNTIMGLSPALQLVKGSASIQRLAVEDIDPGKIERLCGLEGLGRDASFESKRLGDQGSPCC